MNKTKIIAITLIVVILIAGVFGVIYMKNKAYDDGMKDGAEKVVLYIAQLGFNCQKIPITVNNQTMNLVAVECLNNG